jgi:hypothetical protein
MKEGGKPGDGRYKTRKTKRRKIVGWSSLTLHIPLCWR